LNSSYTNQGNAANTTQTTIGNNNAAAEMNNYKVGANQLNGLMGLGSLAMGGLGGAWVDLGGLTGGFGGTGFSYGPDVCWWCAGQWRPLQHVQLRAHMADITQLLANAADTKADFDFGKLNKSYWEGKDQFAKNELRDAFREGVPLGPDGQPDFAAMAKTLFQKGGLEQGVAASNLDISRQQLKNGQALAEKLGQMEGGGQPAPIVSPPSANRGASVPVAPPLNRGGAQPAGQPASLRAPRKAALPRSARSLRRRAFRTISLARRAHHSRVSSALRIRTLPSTRKTRRCATCSFLPSSS
jgi:hypothetical protein